MDKVNYDFYENEFGGTLSADLFLKLSNRVYSEITTQYNIVELNELETYQYNIASCELIDYYRNEKDSILSSLNVDGISKSYKSTQEINKVKNNIINKLPQKIVRCL